MADDQLLEAIPWYRSPQQISHVAAAVSAFMAFTPKLATALHLTTPLQVQAAVEGIFGFIAFIAPVIGAQLRARSKIQPLVISQKKADIVNLAPALAVDPIKPPLEIPKP